MTTKEKYDNWVDRICAFIEKVGPTVNGSSSAMQSLPSLNGECKILFLGHDAHEGKYEGVNRQRFYEGNGTFKNAHKTWRYWARPHQSFQRIGKSDILNSENFMLMNLFYFGSDNINKSNAGMGIEVMRKCIEYTEELVCDIVRPKIVVCFSVGSVFNPLRSRFTDTKHVELTDKISIIQGLWNGIPVIGMKHPSAPNVSNHYLDTVFNYITSFTNK